MRELLIATGNNGKISEYKEIFREFFIPVRLISLEEAGIKEKVEEDEKTLEENSVKKAQFYFDMTKRPTMADDSGLEIDYLDGAPGVNSRRWPGYEASDEEIMKMALEKLKGVPDKKRGAQFRSVISLIIPEDPKVYTFEGKMRGRIAEKPLGKMIAGYPFRSIFIPENSDKHMSELGIVAHRNQAVEKALPIIKKYLI